jgi:hypothetical protein
MAAPDCPSPGQTSYASLGLSEHALVANGRKLALRVELVGVGEGDATALAQALSTACFTIMRTTREAAPGVIVRDVITSGSGEVKHLLLADPLSWEPPLESQYFAGTRVAWLMAIPITEEEARYADTKGADALEDVFETHEVELTDLVRESVALPSSKSKKAGAREKTAAKAGREGDFGDGWSMDIPDGFRRRMEDDAVVHWTDDLTIWSVTAKETEPASATVRRFLSEATPKRTDERTEDDGSLIRCSYRAAGDGGDAKRPSLNAIVAGDRSSLIVSFYFDHERTVELAHQLLASARKAAPKKSAPKSGTKSRT